MVIFQKIISWLLSLIIGIVSMLGFSCGGEDTVTRTDDIVVLYTNDVHCAVDTSIGYAGLVAYKNEMLEETPFVTLVDCGDSIQGATVGSVSRGGYIIDIMNKAGYSYSAVGNHEFDYGMERLGYLIGESDFTWLGCNLTYSGTGENYLENVCDYAIDDYDGTKVAFIGVSTPYSVTSSTPAYFCDEDGNQIYGFSEDDFYGTIQANIDECLDAGADYVVILGHTGNDSTYSPYSSTEIIENTTGIDVYLDAHQHNTIEEDVIEDKLGNDVLLSSTGTGLVNIGKLTIDTEGGVSTELVSGYTEKDAEMQSYIDGINKAIDDDLGATIAYNPVDFSIYENGVRTVRSRENALGDLIADAFRESTSAQIAVINGGGVRNNLASGDISYKSLLSVMPFGNTVVAINVTGSQLLDALEFAYRSVQGEYSVDGHAVGENGSFLHVSGLKLTVDTSVESSVIYEDGTFRGVAGERRVKDVLVENDDGTWSPIDENATYSLAGLNYTLFDCGDGFTMFTSCEKAISDGKKDVETVVAFFLAHSSDYIKENYSTVAGRVTVK